MEKYCFTIQIVILNFYFILMYHQQQSCLLPHELVKSGIVFNGVVLFQKKKVPSRNRLGQKVSRSPQKSLK